MKNILIIIQRSNGDVFLSSYLIQSLKQHYKDANIDMLINDDTLAIAKTIDGINHYHLYSYAWRKSSKLQRYKQELKLIQKIYKKYDLAINLTASDRSVQYAILAGKKSISAVEQDNKKSWWKNLFLTSTYIFDTTKSIVLNNIQPLKLLGIEVNKIDIKANYAKEAMQNVQNILSQDNIKEFIIFHPSAQYDYKIYPQNLRDELLVLLDSIDIPIIITGGSSDIDKQISTNLPKLKNIHNYIGKLSLQEYIALSELSICYIGMDTLNMHIASAQNKRVFAIFGPTILSMWSPWENSLNQNISTNAPIQTYGKITIFQAKMDCVACGLAGCDDLHSKSECLYNISPNTIYNEVKEWIK